MFILDRRKFLELTGAAGAMAGAATLSPRRAHAAPTSADVYTADPYGGEVDSVVIMGDESAVLIDAQFTAPNARNLADMIAATGRKLETIFITHYHPDHVLGLGILMDRFPDAQPVAHAAVQPLIENSAQAMLDSMKAGGQGEFADRVVIPDTLPGDHILLEGERIDIFDPIHGDTEMITMAHIPTLDTLVASDTLFNGTHAWVAENTKPEDIAKWRDTLDLIEGLGVGTIIPGHRSPDAANDASSIAHTRAYLDQWEKALADTTNAEDLKAAMMAGNDGMGLVFAVDRAVATVYPES